MALQTVLTARLADLGLKAVQIHFRRDEKYWLLDTDLPGFSRCSTFVFPWSPCSSMAVRGENVPT